MVLIPCMNLALSLPLYMKSNIPIYDLSSFEHYKNQGVYIGQFGAYAKLHKHLHSTHGHSFYHMVYFSKGTGVQHIDFKQFDIKAGQIYFMIPGQVHSWNFETEPDGYIINFSKDYFSSFLLKTNYLAGFSFFSGSSESQVISMDRTMEQKINFLFEEMLKEGSFNPLHNDDLVRALLLQLFIYLSRTEIQVHAKTVNPYNYTLLQNFRNLIEANFSSLKFPKQYAALLYITPNHLNALCKDLINKSAGQLIRDRIILEAKRLLINLDLSVAQIAEKLDFKDQSYFIKFFKKHEEITPEKFRKLNT
jgi:AraC family transcriptional activator of pobA